MKIVLDIETTPSPFERWLYLKGIPPDKKPDEEFASTLLKEYEKASFDATYAAIVCIGLLLLDDDATPVEALAWCGDEERLILKTFWEKVGSISPKQIITHNGLGFDLPFIHKRSMVHQVRPTISIPLAKFKTSPVFDTMAVWANWEPRSYVGLDVLARAFEVETKSGCGSAVMGYWSQRRFADIAQYCIQDTIVTYHCFCRMNFMDSTPCTKIREKAEVSIFDTRHAEEKVSGDFSKTFQPSIRV